MTVTAADSDLEAVTHIKVVILPTGVQAPESLELDLNGETTKALGAVMTPEDATDVKLAYESSDETVATVDEAGNVTAVGQGECTITTTIVADAPAPEEEVDSAMLVVPENAKAETKVTVGKAVESITLDAAQGTLTVGGSRTIGATVLAGGRHRQDPHLDQQRRDRSHRGRGGHRHRQSGGQCHHHGQPRGCDRQL